MSSNVRWTVIANGTRRGYVLCRCACGVEREVEKYSINKGKSRSCGCLRLDTVTKHGKSGDLIHRVWRAMVSRCHNPNDSHYKYYGQRGIRVCDRWRLSFDAFALDMGPRPKGMEIERRDNDGDYCPTNCFWATRKQQCRNTRRNRNITHDGRTQTLSMWAEELGVSTKFLWQKIKRNGLEILSDVHRDRRRKS